MNKVVVRTSFIFSVLGTLAVPISMMLFPFIILLASVGIIISPSAQLVLWPFFQLLFGLGIIGAFNDPGLVGLLMVLFIFPFSVDFPYNFQRFY